MFEATQDMREGSCAGYYPSILLGVWRFFVLANLEDMDMALAKGIVNLMLKS